MNYRILVFFYSGMALVAIVIGILGNCFTEFPDWLAKPSMTHCLLATAAALLAAWMMQKLSIAVEFLRVLFEELSQALPQRNWTWNALAGILSGVVEEFAFRGVALVLLGPIWSSVGFGLLHIGWKKTMWFWPLYAGLIGYVFAQVTLFTGTLWPAAIAHAVYNFVLLQAMNDH